MGEKILEYCSGNIQAQIGRQEKILVENVSFILEGGKSVALIGETGSGKTMTALSIMKLLPDNVRMLKGVLKFRGEELKNKKTVRKLLGVDIVYIPQNGLEFLNPSKKIRNKRQLINFCRRDLKTEKKFWRNILFSYQEAWLKELRLPL